MAELVNGHVTISVGVGGNGNGGRSRAPASAPLTDARRREKAERLRRDGWSYRRIATALQISYVEVSRLLDGDDGRLNIPYEPVRLPRVLGSARVTTAVAVAVPANMPAPAGAALEELIAQQAYMQQKLDHLVAVCDAHRQTLARLERNLMTGMRNEHQLLSQRLQTALKAMLERMLPFSFRKPEKSDDGA